MSRLLCPHRAAHENAYPIPSSLAVGLGRTSPFRILAAILLASFLPAVRADCYINEYVIITFAALPTKLNVSFFCYPTLGLAMRSVTDLVPEHAQGSVLHSVSVTPPFPSINPFLPADHPRPYAPVALFMLAISAMLVYRRRRANRANLAYIHQTQPGGAAGMYGNPYGSPPPPGPQYPPQAYNTADPSYAYDPRSGFAQVRLRLSSLLSPLLLMLWMFPVVAHTLAAAVLSAPTWRAPPSPSPEILEKLSSITSHVPNGASLCSPFPLVVVRCCISH